jgi:hypothetical protein
MTEDVFAVSTEAAASCEDTNFHLDFLCPTVNCTQQNVCSAQEINIYTGAWPCLQQQQAPCQESTGDLCSRLRYLAQDYTVTTQGQF